MPDNPVSTDLSFQELFNNMTSGAVIYQAIDDGNDFVFVDYNQAGQKMDNTTKELVIGKRLTEVFPGVVEMGLIDILKKVWQTGKPTTQESAQYQDEKLNVWRESSFFRLPSGLVVAFYNDITQRKQLEQELKASRDRLELALQGASEGVWDWNIQTNEIFYSDRCKTMLGYQPEELTNEVNTWRKLLHPDMLEPFNKYLGAYVERAHSTSDNPSKCPTFEQELLLKNKQGEYHPFLAKAQCICDQDNRPHRLIGTLRDLTAEKEFEAKLQAKVEELEKMNKFMVSRELKIRELKDELKQLQGELGKKAT